MNKLNKRIARRSSRLIEENSEGSTSSATQGAQDYKDSVEVDYLDHSENNNQTIKNVSIKYSKQDLFNIRKKL
jgi:hypothetical protein